jgi:hypothetical protein
MPIAFSRPMICQFGFKGLDALAAIVHFSRGGVQADRDAGAGGVDEADRLIGQLARRNVAMRQT